MASCVIVTVDAAAAAATATTTTSCESSQDCLESSEYCADGECLAAGACKVEVDCFNPENVYPTIDCVGYLECNNNSMCGKICSTDDPPYNCKPGIREVNCFVDPCFVADCPEATSCVSNYCGGCNTIQFNAKGTQVCIEEEEKEQEDVDDNVDPPEDVAVVANNYCTTNDDCRSSDATIYDSRSNNDEDDEEEVPDCTGGICVETVRVGDHKSSSSSYCAAGICLDAGKCKIDEDCINPSNTYPMTKCIGPVVCNGETGTCTRNCIGTGSPCANGIPTVRCFEDPCSSSSSSAKSYCKESVACVADYCGGCYARHFDKAGNLICQQQEDDDEDDDTSSDDD
eukprot:scaffold1325_cov95-Cylindrotheca_fusiformis.AAC.6